MSVAATQTMNTRPLPEGVTDGSIGVLDQLDPLLGVTGAMRNTGDIHKLISIMKESDMMVNRCLILNILQATKAPTTLTRFMDAGGWNVLNVWLSEAKRSQNNALMLEILLVLQKLPVTISSLKQGNMGKLVKQLSKQEHPEVKEVATELLSKWMAIFREGQAARGKDSSAPASNSTSGGALAENHHDQEKEREKEKAREEKKLARKSKKEKEALKSPVEAHPPPGPLVALGRPKDKVKRPRDIVSKVTSLPPEKKPRSSSTSEEDKEGSASGGGASSSHKGGIMESESFMNALSSQAVRKVEKRVKKVSKSTGTAAKPSPTQTKPPIDFPGEKGQDVAVPNIPTSVQPPSQVIADMQQDEEETKDHNKESPSPILKTTKTKKRVSWASDPVLVTIHHFELDENERVDVSRSFLDAAQQEKLMEREALSAGRAQFDTLIEMTQWHRPILFSGAIELIKKGSESEQMNIQAEREQKVLGQLFLSKASVPLTPSEPDQDTGQIDTKPKLIPLLEPGAQEVVMAVQGPPLFSPSSVEPGPQYFPVPESPGLVPNQGFKMEDSPMGGSMAPPPVGMPEGQAMLREGPYSSDPGYYMYGPGPGGNPPPGMPGGPPPQGGPPFPPYYGDGIAPMYRGRGGPLRGRGRGMRRGRGSAFLPPRMSHICKHFITHGCRLGSSCKFLHCTPEELASQMANDRTAQPESPQH